MPAKNIKFHPALDDRHRRIITAVAARPWRRPYDARYRAEIIRDLEDRKARATDMARHIPDDAGVRPAKHAEFRNRMRAAAKACDAAIGAVRIADAIAKEFPSVDAPMDQEANYWQAIGQAYFGLHHVSSVPQGDDILWWDHRRNPTADLNQTLRNYFGYRICSVCHASPMVADYRAYSDRYDGDADMCRSCWLESSEETPDWKIQWLNDQRNFPECGCCEMHAGQRCSVDNCHCDRPEDCQNYIQDDSAKCDCDDPDAPCDDCVMVHDPDCEQCCMCDEGFCGEHDQTCDKDCWVHPSCHFCGEQKWDWDTPPEDRLDNYWKLYNDDFALVCDDCSDHSDNGPSSTISTGSRRRMLQLELGEPHRNAFNIAETTTTALKAVADIYSLDRKTVAALWQTKLRTLVLCDDRREQANLIADMRMEAAYSGDGWPSETLVYNPRHEPYARAVVRAFGVHAVDHDLPAVDVLTHAASLLRNRVWNDNNWRVAINNANAEDAELLASLRDLMTKCDLCIANELDQPPLAPIQQVQLDYVSKVCADHGQPQSRINAYGIAEHLWLAQYAILQ